jgi:beta-galactosidase
MKQTHRTNKIKEALPILLFIFITSHIVAQDNRQTVNINSNWQFCNQEDIASTETKLPNQADYVFTQWQTVTLPHTAKVEPQVVVKPWVGVSWYKKDFKPSSDWKNKRVFIEFEAVMQQAEVWLNGKSVAKHTGGYLPFTIDISSGIIYGKQNRIVVKADNQDNADVPPGKPIMNLDFCYFSGIYRNVSLIITNPLHITDAVKANQPASGGVHVWVPEISTQLAKVAVSTHVRNDSDAPKEFELSYIVFDKTGSTVELKSSQKVTLAAQSEKTILENLQVQTPDLWHPNHPSLYTLRVGIIENKAIIDVVSTKIGIRKFEISNNKFFINSEPFLLVGTNRHQEYPYIGNALSDNAQYRDAVKIKEAGFNIVRLSHYPQSPAFMNACDELGILTIAAIPGWQFVGKEAFMQHSHQDARELIRRDRNHASVAMWELSLNESPMPDSFMKKMTEIAKEEAPESKLITCGWIDKYYDVYIPARQHAKAPNYWKKYEGKIPLFTGEYGDWEYFAQDAGLNQAGYAGLKSDERTSRQLRGDGEKRMLQQADNFQEAHNDNLINPHLGDANWLMFDYNRGYSPDIESSGIMDIFRLPKFAYYFYRSQDKPINGASSYDSTPTVKIVSNWNATSDFKNIKVYSNCEEVALYLNDKLVEKKKPQRNVLSEQLPYPPFIFDTRLFEAGQLKAIGYINGKEVKQDIVTTSGEPAYIKLSYDKSGKSLKGDGADAVFLYATVCDAKGNPVPESNASIQFTLKGNGKLIGENPIKAEAGIAAILLQADNKAGTITIQATNTTLKSGQLKIFPVK